MTDCDEWEILPLSVAASSLFRGEPVPHRLSVTARPGTPGPPDPRSHRMNRELKTLEDLECVPAGSE